MEKNKKEFELKHKIEENSLGEDKIIVSGFKNKNQIKEFIKCLERDWE